MIDCKLCEAKHRQLMKPTPCGPCPLPNSLRLPEKRNAPPIYDELRIMQTYKDMVSPANTGGGLNDAIIATIWGPDVDVIDTRRIKVGLVAISNIVALDEDEVKKMYEDQKV